MPGDPSNLAGLDENDPQSMARFMKTMGEEMGEDLGDDSRKPWSQEQRTHGIGWQ